MEYSSYIIGIFVGGGIGETSSFSKIIKINLKAFSKLLVIPFSIFTAIIILSTISSNIPEDKFASKQFCTITPSIWRNCVDAGVQAISRGEFYESSEILGRYLEFYPNNFIAQRYYAFSLAKLGKTEEACHVLEKYDNLFSGKSSVHEIKKANCQK